MKTTAQKLSPAQDKALRAIVAGFDARNAANVARWGSQISTVNACDVLESYDYRTLFALERAGYITVECYSHGTERLRKGSWGRLLGGTHQSVVVNHMVRPTDAARALLGK